MNISKLCTLVTAFYDFEKKKNSSDKYYEWMANFLPHSDAYMVIFTDEKNSSGMFLRACPASFLFLLVMTIAKSTAKRSPSSVIRTLESRPCTISAKDTDFRLAIRMY